MRTLIRKIERARGAEIDMDWLAPVHELPNIKAGETLFRKDDIAEAIYLIHSDRFE